MGQERKKVKNGLRYDKNGWIYVSVKGTAKERGYANGFLLSAELKRVFHMADYNLFANYGYSRSFFSEVINELIGPQISQNYPEFYEEMEYIVHGANAAGFDKLSLADIIMWNFYCSIDSIIGHLPTLINANSKLKSKYGELFLDAGEGSSSAGHGEGGGGGGGVGGKRGTSDKCTAFIAVGSYTKDGKIVVAHNSFDNFIDAQFSNVILSIRPSKGADILMQTTPGCIWSCTDFYVTSYGMICTETTIGGFTKFRLKDPICCRIRQAMQYGKTLKDCLDILKHNNSGDYANSWLIGDTNTNTIMRIELGLDYVGVEEKKDGYFIGFNAPYDPQIRNLECVNTGFDDIRRHQGARRVRLTQLMEQHKGHLDLALGESILADHYDVYLQKENPSSRTCCGHYELDNRAFMSQADRPKPYQPRGAVDGVVCDTTLAKYMTFRARWGSSCGLPFDKTAFCKEHIQWADQEPYLSDRPSQPWTQFSLFRAAATTGHKTVKGKVRKEQPKIVNKNRSKKIAIY